MKAHIPVVSEAILEWRKRTGAERWDEVWNGVLHLPPTPNREHQELEAGIERFVHLHWARPNKAKVYHQINLAAPGEWPDKDYRIPDLVLLSAQRAHIDRNEYFEGAPDGVVEIRSHGDETLEKLDFYAQLGVPEVWIIDRDIKEPHVLVLRRNEYVPVQPADPDWLRSPQTVIELRRSRSGKLDMRAGGDDATREELPEE